MDTKEYKEVFYTIEIDWEGGNVWINNHASKEKMVLSEKDAKSISNDFLLLKARREGRL